MSDFSNMSPHTFACGFKGCKETAQPGGSYCEGCQKLHYQDVLAKSIKATVDRKYEGGKRD